MFNVWSGTSIERKKGIDIMSWEAVLKIRIGLIMPIVKECIIPWSEEQEVGSIFTLTEIRDKIRDCYFENIKPTILERHPHNPSMSTRYRSYWTNMQGYDPRLSNALMMNMTETNKWQVTKKTMDGRQMTLYEKIAGDVE